MLNKNQTITFTVTDISDTGEGIGHVDGITVFAANTVPGDTVEALVIKTKKTYAIAKMTKILSPSPDRVTPSCPVYSRCGGCQLQSLSYEAELRLKQKKVQDCITRIGGFSELTVPPVLGMREPAAYRNKGQFPAGEENGRNGTKEPLLGFYSSHSHRIVPTDRCEMLFPGHEEILRAVRDYLLSEKVSIYNEETGKGLLRHVLMRKGKASGELLVCLVVNGERLPRPETLWDRLKEIPGVIGLTLNVNRLRTNVILGDRLVPLFGKADLTDSIGDISFHISPMSFYQVNPDQTRVLYGLALEYAELTGKENVWDLYCGIGSISLFLAKKAGRVHGIEIIPEAVKNAEENARRNKIDNAEFYVGEAETIFPRLLAEDPSLTADVICLDPPRKGCDRRLLDTILSIAPKRIVYVSCDPATLARDLKILCEQDYRIRKIQPVDMFPRTTHVETVCLLSKLSEAKHSIDVKLDMDELDVTSAETKATYEEIKAYVLEQTGLQVSSLYIAQVKRECGIIERENYKKPKAEDANQPQCPEDKRKAIKEALIHFGMI